MSKLGEWSEKDALPQVRGARSNTRAKTGMSKADLLRRYRDRLDMCRKWRKDEKHDDTWRRMIDLYRGKHYQGMAREDRIVVNAAFSTINVIGPSVAINYPKIVVTARHEYHDAQAAIAEVVVNYWWRHYDFHPEVRRVVHDAIVLGHGWAKVGWRYEATKRELSDEEFEQGYAEMRQQADAAAEANPVMAGELPSDDDIAAQLRSERKDEVAEDRPFVERVSPFDVLVDPEATFLSDAKWICQRIVRPLEDVKKDEAYAGAARSRLKADAAMNPRWRDERERGKYSDDIARVTIYEWYDLQHGLMCVFPEQGDEFLVAPTEFPYPFGHPFVMLRNYDVPDQFYPLGDLEMLEPLQHELNATRSQMMNHRKRFNRKHLGRRASFDAQSLEAVESDEDNVIVWIDDDRPLNDIIAPIPQEAVNADLYNYSQQIEMDMDLVSGVSEYQRGVMSEIRRTATEAAMIQDAANARAADKLAKVELFLREVSERLVQLGQENLTGEHVAHIAGGPSTNLWVPFQREDIQGEFDFEVEAGSTQPRNETQRAQQALQLMNVISPFVGMFVDGAALVKYVLRDGFGIQNPEQFMVQQMIDPMTGQPMAPAMGMQGPGPQSEATALPTSGPQAIPPEVLTQLQGQVGLNLPNLGA